MTAEEEAPVPGLRELPRELAPARDLWPGIAPRLRRRRNPQPWIGLALAASVVVALAVQLRWQHAVGPDPALPESAAAAPMALAAAMPSHQRALVKANLKIADDAASQLQRALRQQPDSASLQRLLVGTRRQQHELRRLLDAPPESPSAV
jgi:hypothetical protein